MSQEPKAQDNDPTETAGADAQDRMDSLAEAFAVFTKTTASLEASYQLLEERVQSLDAELQAKNEELATTTEYLNSILDSMSDGVVVVDRNDSVTTVNRAAGEMLGLSPDDAETLKPESLLGTNPDALNRLHEIELPTQDGKSVPVSAKTSPITDENDEAIGTVTVFQDLRELESLRKQVRQRDRLAAIGEMAATVAHEIRNPLGGIQGFASLLARDLEADSDAHRLVEKIVTGTKNLNRIVNNLLEYTRPIELDLSEVKGREIVDSAIGYCTRPDGVSIENLVPETVTIRCDHNQIRQVFLNVLINGVQSVEGNGQVTVAAKMNSDTVSFSIADTGCGIEKDDLEQIFMPFHTTKEKGTGLGLAAASKIVEGHGGNMRVESSIGVGTTFFVTLPMGS